MNNGYNPFRENRTEQMKDLWKYYVPFPGLDATGKPVIIEGGRGSGKTMFFQCNSWRQIYLQNQKEKEDVRNIYKKNGFIGIYYRVDTTFVSAMCYKNNENWEQIFETYLSICIVQEILDLILVISDELVIKNADLESFVQDFSKRFNPDSSVETLKQFRGEMNQYLDIIEDNINGLERNSGIEIRWVKAHRMIRDVCEACSALLEESVLFKIFIDEYETLQEYQQKIVNTLIKHSSLPVIFNIGLKPKGMKTNATISNTETIEAPHDYEPLELRIEAEKYNEILREICKKRISLGKMRGEIPEEASEDIEFYLGSYSVDTEIEKIMGSSKKAPHIQKLIEKIEELGKAEKLTMKTIQKYQKELAIDAPMLNSRVHFALLCKKTAYTPTVQNLYSAYTGKTIQYMDWMHNRKIGAVFLLCKEFKREKLYYGFDVYAALSSNVVRYFLELCEQAFYIAFLSDYKWDAMLEPELQTEAARCVSEYKIMDIARYEPYGRELRLFVQYLGQIFYKLHTTELNTLGEPEPNHFSTKDLSLSVETKRKIAVAVMCNVLQEGAPTKRKQSKLSPETLDYYLNKIYIPYFGISYRNQRKIQLSVEHLQNLLDGDESLAKSTFRDYFKMQKEEMPKNGQLTLFDLTQGETE